MPLFFENKQKQKPQKLFPVEGTFIFDWLDQNLHKIKYQVVFVSCHRVNYQHSDWQRADAGIYLLNAQMFNLNV